MTAPLTVGQLARASGVSAQTLRHYDALGLLRPSAKSAARYRLYDETDRARLDVIRALRALDFDLATIGRLVRGTVRIADAARLHLDALNLQSRSLERRRAVLRVLLRGGAPPTPERLARLQSLSSLERMERQAFVDEQLGARLRGTRGPAALQRSIREAAVLDLPEHPTEAQVEAWLELAEMVANPDFLARHRRASGSSWAPTTGRAATNWHKQQLKIFGEAANAAKAGVAPTSARGRRIVRRWIGAQAARAKRRDLSRFATEMLAMIERQDPRETRFWELLAVLKPEIARSPMSIGWRWMLEGLRAVADCGVRTAD